MTQEEIQNFIAQEVSRQVQLEMAKVDNFMKIDKYVFDKHCVFMDGRNIQIGRTTGTKIGTATDQKIGFYGTTPLAKQTGVAVTAGGVHAALVALGLIAA